MKKLTDLIQIKKDPSVPMALRQQAVAKYEKALDEAVAEFDSHLATIKDKLKSA